MNNNFVDREFLDARYSGYNGYKNNHILLTYAWLLRLAVSYY